MTKSSSHREYTTSFSHETHSQVLQPPMQSVVHTESIQVAMIKFTHTKLYTI